MAAFDLANFDRIIAAMTAGKPDRLISDLSAAERTALTQALVDANIDWRKLAVALAVDPDEIELQVALEQRQAEEAAARDAVLAFARSKGVTSTDPREILEQLHALGYGCKCGGGSGDDDGPHISAAVPGAI